MKRRIAPASVAVAGLFAAGLALPIAHAQSPCSPRSPCSGRTRSARPASDRNPCAAAKPTTGKGNPCAAKNPCNAGPMLDPALVTRPKGTKLASGDKASLLKTGEQLWNDKKLSTNNLSCSTCHSGGAAFNASFAKPYPHQVAMAKDQAGMRRIDLDEMVQLCLVKPMATKPLAWNSHELAALTIYTGEVQKSFIKSAAARSSNAAASAKPGASRENPCAPARK